MFFTTMVMFFFDFVSINVGRNRTTLTGFNLLSNEIIGYNVWLALVFVGALAGFVISLINGKIKYGIGFLLALAGIILLLVAQFSIIEKYGTNGTIITFEPAYWYCLASFAFAGSRCYLLQYKTSQRKEIVETKGVVNINIITQSNKANEK